jgi:hypothetical protein
MNCYYQDVREIIRILEDYEISGNMKLKLQQFDELTNKSIIH